MIYKFAVVLSVIFIIFIINLIRKNKMDEKYSILWLFFGIVMLIISAFPELLSGISKVFSVYYPPSLMFAFTFVIVGAYIVHLCMVVTKQNKMLVKLTQELAILRQEVDKDKK